MNSAVIGSPITIKTLQAWGIEPYIATGREPHQHSWREFFAQTPQSPPTEASLRVKMAYQLQTKIGRAIYRLRKCTVEPVIGIIKEVLGFDTTLDVDDGIRELLFALKTGIIRNPTDEKYRNAQFIVQ